MPCLASSLAQKPIVQQAGRFAVTTGLSATLSFGLPLLLVEVFNFSEYRAVQIGFATAYIVNIWVLRHYVFNSKNPWHHDVLLYVVTNAAFRLTEYAAFAAAMRYLDVPYYLIIFMVLAISSILKFFCYRFAFLRKLTK